MTAYARRVRGYWITVMAVFCLWALAPGSASAGVYVDPGSAPGKEYEIPLDRVRNDAAPGEKGPGSSSGGSATPAPAFGVGLDRGSGRSSGDGAGSRDNDREQDAGSRPGAEAPGGEAVAPDPSDGGREVSVQVAGSTEGGVGSTLTFSAVGIGALLLGAAFGLLLRRQFRHGRLQG
jgi:hypothetical protein